MESLQQQEMEGKVSSATPLRLKPPIMWSALVKP
jgi:hypothetical protein